MYFILSVDHMLLRVYLCCVRAVILVLAFYVSYILQYYSKDLSYIEEMGKPKLQQHRQSKLKTSKSEGIFKFNGCITCRRECIKFIPVAVQQ